MVESELKLDIDDRETNWSATSAWFPYSSIVAAFEILEPPREQYDIVVGLDVRWEIEHRLSYEISLLF